MEVQRIVALPMKETYLTGGDKIEVCLCIMHVDLRISNYTIQYCAFLVAMCFLNYFTKKIYQSEDVCVPRENGQTQFFALLELRKC